MRQSQKEMERRGLQKAVHIATDCQLTYVDDMTPRQAAEAMKRIIASAIEAHVEIYDRAQVKQENSE